MRKRNEIVSPRFDEPAYKGQDVVNQGIRIPLKGYKALDLLIRFSKQAQSRIKLPAQDDTGITYIKMRDIDLEALRNMWFDPNDPTFPTSMQGHIGILAIKDEMPIGGVTWTPEGKNLFMHQLISSEIGKKLHLPTLLVWHSVMTFIDSEWHSLDIGVSYNPKRYAFFEHFAVEQYPIILKKPENVPVIRLTPFRIMEGLKDKPDQHDYAKNNCTFLPRGAYALYAALKHIGVGEGDHVSITKTFGSDYISGCVTKMIEKTGAKWHLSKDGQDIDQPIVKAVVAVHEFGLPIFQERDLAFLKRAADARIPIIEDCAWRETTSLEHSDYQVFSAGKVTTIGYGGMLRGVHIPDEQLWEWGVLDVYKRYRIAWEKGNAMDAATRKKHWWLFHQLVLADGMTPDDCYDYAGAIERGEWTPTIYLLKLKDDAEADAVVERLEEFGIQAGRYWGEPLIFLPIHQNMTREEVIYMFAVVRGYFNACRDYGKVK